MADNRGLLYALLCVIGLLLGLIIFQNIQWNRHTRSTAIRYVVENQNAYQTRRQLKEAMTLLAACFGRKVDLRAVKTAPVTITAYSSTKRQCDSTPYITASKTPVRVGTLAVSVDFLDKMGLSFGQRVLIPGYGLFVVKDSMNPRWRRRVDIWESNTRAARLFGTHKGTLIWLADKGKGHPELLSNTTVVN